MYNSSLADSSMQKPQHPLYIVILAFIAIYLVWGSTYLFVAYAVEEVPPFMMAGIRFLIASSLIFIFSPLFMDWKSITRAQLINATKAGFWFLILGNGAMTYALQFIDSGFSSLMVSAQPLVLILMMYFMYRKPIDPFSLLGVALGILGMYLLVSQKEIISTPDQWKGFLVILTCLFTWGYGSLFVAKADLPKNHFASAGIQMFISGIALIIGSFIFGEKSPHLFEISTFTWGCILYLSIFGSIIAFTSFNFLLTFVSPEKVSTSTYVNPIVALFLGWFFRDEYISTQSIIATAILFAGVYFINSSRFEKKNADNLAVDD